MALAEVYDPATETWSPVGDMTSGKGRHGLIPLGNGNVLAIGGSGLSAELYDLSADTWVSGGDSAIEREFHSAALLGNGKVLVIGGGDSESAVDSVEIYDPVEGSWSPTESMIEPRRGPRATVLADGRVLVTGGAQWDGHVFLTGSHGAPFRGAKTAEIYDRSSSNWSSAGTMASSRDLHTATLLQDGRVLVAGGGNKSTEIYDPSTDSWSAAADLLELRKAHTATLLPDGRVLVVGGSGGQPSGLPLSRRRPPRYAAEVYDPLADTWTPSTEAAR